MKKMEDLNEKINTICRALMQNRCSMTHWISNSIAPADFTKFGYEFKVAPIKGLVVFGIQYPLNGFDLTIDDHIKMLEFLASVEKHGAVLEDASFRSAIGDKVYHPINKIMVPFRYSAGEFFPHEVFKIKINKNGKGDL